MKPNAQEWDVVWARKNFFGRTIDLGREVYNSFFRRLLRRYLRPSSTLLEIGCGTSTLTLSLAPEITSLTGVDISEEALERSRNKALEMKVTNAVFLNADCLNLSFKDAFDVVWSQGLLEHFDDPQTVVNEHFKALKPGGIALLSVPYRYSYHYVWYLLTRPACLRKFWPWTEQQFYTKKDLEAFGLKVTPHVRVFFLRPFLLGLALLELKKTV